MKTFKQYLEFKNSYRQGYKEHIDESVPIGGGLIAYVKYSYIVNPHGGSDFDEFDIDDLNIEEIDVYSDGGTHDIARRRRGEEEVPMRPEYKQIALKYFNTHLRDEIVKDEYQNMITNLYWNIY